MDDSPGQNALREYYGVARMPVPLGPAELSAFYPPEYLGSGKSSPVLVTIDLSEAGEIDRVEAILPPGQSSKIRIEAILAGPGGERRLHAPARTLDPLFARAAEASVRAMRFSAAEREGRAVPFRDFRMTLWFSDPRASEAPGS